MSEREHKAAAPDRIACHILTVSDTRTLDTDKSGKAIEAALEAAGREVAERVVVPDDPPAIRARLLAWVDAGAQVILTNGGTGIAARDTTYEAVCSVLDKRIDGFGELFRMLSYEEIGPAAMLSRAVAGVAGRTVIIAMPGSTGAVRTAMDKLVIPEIGHLVQQVNA